MCPAKLLLAEDDPDLLSRLAAELQQAGYEVHAASDGAGAQELARLHQPDLAILETRLPDMSGIQVARSLREHYRIPCMFLSSRDDRVLVEHAAKAGALAYLVKPVDTLSLIPSIETALEVAASLDELQSSQDRFEQAQETNRLISIAVGIYMEQFRVGEAAAFDALRKFARSSRRKLVDVARELVQSADRRNEMAAQIKEGAEESPRPARPRAPTGSRRRRSDDQGTTR